MSKPQDRVIELQRRIKIANDALGKIAHGCRDPEGVANDALYSQIPLEPKVQLQGIVGHERNQSRR